MVGADMVPPAVASCGALGMLESEPQKAVEIDPADLMTQRLLIAGPTADIFAGELNGGAVAIKEYRRRSRLTLQQQLAFWREVRNFGSLEHPNLVRLIGACTLGTPMRIVTELCEGGSLYELLYERCEVELSSRQRRSISSGISSGMAYLHGLQPQIIHRDLTSFNCLLRANIMTPMDEVVVKVGNFGLARMKEGDARRQAMTSDVGTLVWMAPEILANEDYDAKVDVYSFGIILFEVLCRSPPFEDLDVLAFQEAVTSGVRPDIDLLPADTPSDLVDLMTRCWSQDPGLRPNFADVV